MKKLSWLVPWLLVASLWGQDRTPPPDPSPSATQPSKPGEETKDKEKNSSPKITNGTSHDRLFFTLPNFLTLENAGKVPPLTTAQKFKVTVRSSFDYVEYFWYGALAGVAQAENNETSYGQGAEGYAKRFGLRFADGTIENFTTKAIFPSLLREDPRYFQLGEGGFWHRVRYAMGRIIITRTDSGHNRVNLSEILGSGTAAAISTYSYHPANDHDVGDVVTVWGSQVAYDTLSYVVKEFWPDIRRKLHKSKADQTP